MSVFCPVAPARILQRMFVDDPMTIRHNLFLAHDVVKTPEEYFQLFGKGFKHGSHMDNSLVELGGAVDVTMVAEAVKITRAQTFVLPDVYRNGPETSAAILSNYSTWQRKIDTAFAIGVIQGADFKEWIECLEEVTRVINLPWIAVPRVAMEWAGSRWALIELVHMYAPKARIHLLGFSDNMVDDLRCARHPWVSSIDSAVPVRMGSTNQQFSLTINPGPRSNWWDVGPYAIRCVANTRLVSKLCNTSETQRSADIGI